MNLLDLFCKITLDPSDYERGLDEASGKTSGFADKLKTGLANAAKAGAAAMAAATAAVTAFAKASIDTGMQFDSAMSQVAATMGTTVDQIQNLRDFAMEMGASTAFSANEAAEALNFMALAGYDADQAMEALPNVLNLAAAGGIALAQASDMVTDAQSALGLSMEESAELVDKMAMASSKSNTSVAQLGDAILTIGGTAKNLAGGTTELATALGILADNGIKGAEGGTALRNIVLSLSAPTDTAAKAMRNLGLEVYDADGNMRPLNETFGDLEAVLSTMTQGEQTEVLNTIFNKVDLKSVNALLANTGERFYELSGYIDNATGSAEKMAATQLDNLTGDITLMKSALEGAQIILSDQLTPNLRSFVQFGSSGITQIADAFKEGGLSGAMDAFSDVLSDGLDMVISGLPQMLDAGAQLLGAVGKGIVSNLPTIGKAALQIGKTLLSKIAGEVPNIFDAGIEIIQNLSSGVSSAIPEFLSVALPAILDFSGMLRENFGNFVDTGIDLIQNIAKGIADGLPVLIENVPLIVSNIAGLINDNALKILQAGVNIVITLGTGIIQAIPTLVANIPQIITAIVDVITAFQWIDIGKNIIEFFGNGIKSMVNFVKEAAKNVRGSVTDTLKNLPQTLLDLGKKIFTDFGDAINSMKTWVIEKVSGISSGVITTLKQLPTKAIQIGKDLLTGLWSGISDKVEWLKRQVSGVVDTIKSWFTGSEGFDEHSPSKWSQGVADFVMRGLEKGFEAGENSLYSTVDSIIGDVMDRFNSTDGSGLSFGGVTAGSIGTGSIRTASVDFQDSAVGLSSAATINAVSSAAGNGQRPIFIAKLILPDGRVLAETTFDDLVNYGSANGTPITTK